MRRANANARAPSALATRLTCFAPGYWLRVAVAVSLLAIACKRDIPATAPPKSANAQAVEVNTQAGWLFTHATPEGTFVTVDNAEQVPAIARGVVRAQNPKQIPQVTRGEVWVVNLARLVAEGKAPAKPVSRELFETQALALLPPGDSSILSDRPQGADAGAPVVASGDKREPQVILYGTSWCGACRTARQYFMAHDIAFVDKDIEKDPRAAEELKNKAARLGVTADRVPVLDVLGRLLIGFEPTRVEALLGETI